MSKAIRILNCDWLSNNYSCDLESIHSESGTCGTVYLVNDKNKLNEKVLKIIERDPKDDREVWINECTKEILALQLLTLENNSYSVKLEDFYIGLDIKYEFENSAGKKSVLTCDMIFLVLEKATSNLQTLMKKGFDLNLMDNLVVSLVQGLQPAHQKNLVHLDIKPQNILFFEPKAFKYADWGISGFLRSKGAQKTKNFEAKEYIPPELDNDKDDNEIPKSFLKADIFACGQIIMEACGLDYRGQVRRSENHHDSDINQGWNMYFKVHPEFKEYKKEFKAYQEKLELYSRIISDMCCFDPKKRLDIDPLITKYRNDLPFITPVKKLWESDIDKEIFRLNNKIAELKKENEDLKEEIKRAEVVKQESKPPLLDAKINEFEESRLLNISGIRDCLERMKDPSILSLEINFSYNEQLVDDALILVCRRLFELKDLEKLFFNLDYCTQISDKGASYLAAGLGHLTNLRKLTLYFWETQITDKGATDLTGKLGHLKNLTDLSLSLGSTQISDQGISNMSEEMAKLKTLTKIWLNLKYTKITDLAASDISSGISQLKNLTKLEIYFTNTKISDKAASYLAAGLSQLKNLTHLELGLRGTNMSEKGLQILRTKLNHISSLDLYR